MPRIAEACAAARTEVDALLWDRSARGRAAEIVAASALVGARDSAALDGAEMSLDAVRAGLDSSPLGRAVAASVAVTAGVPQQVDTWGRAPLQVLAHLHAVAARSFEDSEQLGRPRRSDDVVDALHIGPAASWQELPSRLTALADLLTAPSEAPALLVAAIAHGEILALRPFRWGSGLVARAAVRLVIASRGLDPDLMSCPEAGMLSLGRTSYVAAVRGYLSGEPEGMAEWVAWNAAAVGFGASRASAHRASALP